MISLRKAFNIQIPKNRVNLKIGISSHLVILLMLICTVLNYSCGSIQEQVRAFERGKAIKRLKQGQIRGNLYINDYYRCHISFDSDFSPRLNYPKELLVLDYKDGISQVKLIAKESLEGKFDIRSMVEEFGNKPTYHKILETDYTFNRLKGKEVIYRHRMNQNPKHDLMISQVYFFTCERFGYIISFSTLTALADNLKAKWTHVLQTFTITKLAEVKHRPYEETKAPFTAQVRPEPLEEPFLVHKLKGGETLFIIAKHYTGDGRKWKEIAEFNLITDATRILPGQAIKIPKRICINTVTAKEVALRRQAEIKKEVVSEEKEMEKEVTKIDFTILRYSVDNVWKVILNILETDKSSIKLKSEEKHVLMTEYITKNGIRYRYSVKLDSPTPGVTKAKVICSAQRKRKDSSWENPIDMKGADVWVLENIFYDKIQSMLEVRRNHGVSTQ